MACSDVTSIQFCCHKHGMDMPRSPQTQLETFFKLCNMYLKILKHPDPSSKVTGFVAINMDEEEEYQLLDMSNTAGNSPEIPIKTSDGVSKMVKTPWSMSKVSDFVAYKCGMYVGRPRKQHLVWLPQLNGDVLPTSSRKNIGFLS